MYTVRWWYGDVTVFVVQVKSLEGDLRKSQRLLEDLREKTKLEEVSLLIIKSCTIHQFIMVVVVMVTITIIDNNRGSEVFKS